MAKTSKPKKQEEAAAAAAKEGNGETDIFKLIFGRVSGEEPGLGLVFDSNPKNEETEVKQQKKKKKHKKKERKPDSDDDDTPNSIDDVVEVKKRKRDKEKEIHLGIESIGSDQVKKRKKDIEEPTSGGIGSIEERSKKKKKRDDDKDGVLVKSEEEEKKKKKRKRDEIEEVYEAKMYGVDTEDGVGKKVVVGEKRKTMDDPAELMVSKEGFDDESKLLRTVFVGNLPLKIKKKALLKEFSRFGEVESLRIRSVPILDSKVPRKGAIIKGNFNETVDSVHAYIVFKEEQSAKAALANNMTMVGGNHVRVDMACPPRKKLKGDDAPLYDNKRTVFVGNIPFDVKDEELYQLFCGLNQLESSIEAVRVIRDPYTSMGKGIAYVLLKTREAASLLVKRRHLKLRDRDLRLYPAKPESTLPKKRNVPLTSGDHSSSKRLAVASGGNNFTGNKDKAKATLPYQGLRASKTGIQKKEFSHKRSGSEGGMQKSVSDGPARKVRSSKRPAVAARKSKELRLASAPGGPREMGTKRKMENRTPEKFNRNKKPRQFR